MYSLGTNPNAQQKILGMRLWHSFGTQGLKLKVCVGNVRFWGHRTLGFCMLALDYYWSTCCLNNRTRMNSFLECDAVWLISIY